MGTVRSEVRKKTVAFGFGRCPTSTRPLPLLVCRCPNAHTAFAALVVVRLNLTRTHPRACVAFRSEVDWGQRGVAVKASAVGVVRWQTHRFTHAHTHARAQAQLLTTHAHRTDLHTRTHTHARKCTPHAHHKSSPHMLTTHAQHTCTPSTHAAHTCAYTHAHTRMHTHAHTHAHTHMLTTYIYSLRNVERRPVLCYLCPESRVMPFWTTFL